MGIAVIEILLYLWFSQIPHHEPVRETAVIQTPEEKDPLSLSTNGQPEDAPYEQEQEEVEEEEDQEGPGSEPEEPLDDVSGEPTEPGTYS